MWSEKESSRSIVESILRPLPIEEFLGTYWYKRPLHLRGAAGRFSELFSWDHLSRFLEWHTFDEAHMRLALDGVDLDRNLYAKTSSRDGTSRINAGAISTQIARGATLILNCVDEIHPPLARLADALKDVLPAWCGINVYASWRTDPGLGLHWDDHGVIVLQVAGRKHWTVHAPTRVDPLKGDSFEAPPPDAEPAWEGVLEDGEALYVPRGWSHLAKPLGEPSLHLTCGLLQLTGADYLEWLLNEQREAASVRSAIPVEAGGPEREAWLSDLRENLLAAMDIGSLDAFLAYKAGRQLARPKFAFPGFSRVEPSEWSAETRFRLASNRVLGIRETADSRCFMTSGSAQFPCKQGIVPALRGLSSSHEKRLADLESAIEPDARKDLHAALTLLTQFGVAFSYN